MESIAEMVKVFNASQFRETGDRMFLKDELDIEGCVEEHFRIPIITDRTCLGPDLKTFRGSQREIFRMPEIEQAKSVESFEPFYQGASNVTPDGKIVKKVLKPGSGATPISGAPVWIHYISFVEGDMEPLDATLRQKIPHAFILGNATLECWNYGVASMQLGEIALFVSHPDYAFKACGSPPIIPPNSKLLFFVELINVPASQKIPILSLNPHEVQNLPLGDLVQEVERLFSIKNYTILTDFNIAKQSTVRAIILLQLFRSGEKETNMDENGNNNDIEIAKTLAAAYAHLAHCYLNAFEPENVCALAERWLDLNLPENAAFIYSLSEAYMDLGKLDESLIALQAAVAVQEDPVKAERILGQLYLMLEREEEIIFEESMTYFRHVLQQLTPPERKGWCPNFKELLSSLKRSARSYMMENIA